MTANAFAMLAAAAVLILIVGAALWYINPGRGN